ncbi:hypothetical protein V3C41_11380 [Paenarthrobacter nicotinovorans]|uniref:TetR family transcriptional regulator n=1 Tax=Paenarthrobacter nicotinovorans TaxID=29320 RepID=A0ABV0GT91_PAENI
MEEDIRAGSVDLQTSAGEGLNAPGTREELAALSLEGMADLVGRVVAYTCAWGDEATSQFEREGVNMAIESVVGVFAATFITEAFDAGLIDFKLIEAWQWRSIESVARIIFEAVQNRWAL